MKTYGDLTQSNGYEVTTSHDFCSKFVVVSGLAVDQVCGQQILVQGTHLGDKRQAQ
jgi:hypothetical protein